jgi:hypothetical protein
MEFSGGSTKPGAPSWLRRVPHEAGRNLETKAEYMRVLRIFEDLIMHGKFPGE